MKFKKYRLYSKAPNGDMHLLGRGVYESAREAMIGLMDTFWDDRLDCVGCTPYVERDN